MTSVTVEFKPVVKDRLFYDRFTYCIGFQLDEVSCLRELSHENIDEFIRRRQIWREISQQRWGNGKQVPKNSILVGRRWKEITADTIKNLHDLANLLLISNTDYKLVVSVDQGWVYTNDLYLIDQIDQMTALKYKHYSKAKIDRPKNTIRLKNSKYQYRGYFRVTKLQIEQKNQLTKFLETQKISVRLSPALQLWLRQNFNRTQDYFFVDYDNPQWLTMLGLVAPGLIRKTVQIIPAK